MAEPALDTRHPNARADAPPNDTPVEPAPEAQGPGVEAVGSGAWMPPLEEASDILREGRGSKETGLYSTWKGTFQKGTLL